jgi:nicotinate-nucleotide pyrophosphorylase (carboxylating)
MAETTITRDEIIRLSLNEDIGTGDITAALIPSDTRATGYVICRDAAVIAGSQWFDQVFQLVDPTVNIEWQIKDGDQLKPQTKILSISGNARSILTGERTALNFLQTLSATASKTKRYVDAIAGTGATILDTRKTLPGLRDAQKYAVTCGGGKNHRHGLYDGILIKENHIVAAGSISAAVSNAKTTSPQIKVEVEVETLDELVETIAAGADIALLDNMPPATLREAVALNKGRIKLEASGGITLDNIRHVAETGVDFISIGALTKDIEAIDLSMRLEYR